MTNYTPTPDYYNDYIAHWRPAGWTKKDHKYISRKRGKNGKWQYIYETVKSKVRKVTDKIDKDHDWLPDVFDRNITKPQSAMKKDPRYDAPETSAMKGDPRYKAPSTAEKGAKPNSESNEVKVYKYYKKIKLANGKYRYFYSASEYERYSKRISVLDKDYQFMQDVPVLPSRPKASNVAKYIDVGTDKGNCTSCAMAFELAMRGYDVKSRPDIDGASPDDYILGVFKGTTSGTSNNWYLDTTREENKYYNYKKGLTLKTTSEEEKLQIAQNDLERTIKERGGDNQRGFMTISWTQTDEGKPSGGGHVFNYVVENGQVKYYDAQKGEKNGQQGGEIDIKTYLDNTDYLKHSNKGTSDGGYRTYCALYRIDDKDINEHAKDYIQYTPEVIHDEPEEEKKRVRNYR